MITDIQVKLLDHNLQSYKTKVNLQNNKLALKILSQQKLSFLHDTANIEMCIVS